MASAKRRRIHKSSGKRSPGPATKAGAPSGASEPFSTHFGRWPRWALRWAAVFLVPSVLLVLLEATLRLAGYGYSTDLFLRLPGGRGYTLNEDFIRQFYPRNYAGKTHPFLLPAEKPANAVRIFVLGESAALGTPNPSFGFSRILEVMLRSQYPQKRFAVINAAMRGIDSHVVLRIAESCTRQQPDLFLVYMGNNEAVGRHAAGPESTVLDRNLSLIHLGQWLKRTKLGQLLTAVRLRVERAEPPEQDMPFFRAHRTAADDFRREAVRRNFRANLEQMCQLMCQSGAKVILSTVPANLKDCPPLASLHRPTLTAPERVRWQAAYDLGIAAESAGEPGPAIGHYQVAARADDHYAELQFRLARCLYNAGRFDQAAQCYRAARDWDALPFRVDAAANDIIREVASMLRAQGVSLVDAERALADSPRSPHQVPGADLFYDHVHLRFAGDYLLASAFLPALSAALSASLGQPAKAPIPSEKECADRLAFTAWDELQAEFAMVKVQSRPPFDDQLEHARTQSAAEKQIAARKRAFRHEDVLQALAAYRQAIALDPDDWQLHENFGRLCYLIGDYGTAADHLAVSVKTFPHLAANRLALGYALSRSGRGLEAIEQFTQALKIDPHSKTAQEALGLGVSQ